MMLTILRITYLRLSNNPLELLLIFVMPVIFFSIFATIFSHGIASGTDKKIRVGWVWSQETALGQELRTFLEANTSLEVSSLTDEPHEDHQDDNALTARILQAQQTGQYDLIVKLPPSFPNELETASSSHSCPVSLITDGQNPLAVAMVSSIVRGFFSQKSAALAVAVLLQNRPRPDPKDSAGEGASTPAVKPSAPGIKPAFEGVRNPDDVFVTNEEAPWIDPKQTEMIGSPSRLSSAATVIPETDEETDVVNLLIETPQAVGQVNPRIAMFAAGIAVLFLLFSATGHAATLLEEVESGTLDRILVSQAGLFHILMGKWLAILTLGCLQVTVMFLWAEAVFRIQLAQHWVGFCVMTVSTSAATASFAMFLASLCNSRAQLSAVSTVLILSMSAMGGSMIPRFAMSDRMKEVGKWSFNAWALDGFQKVFWFQSPLSSLQMEVTMLLGSAALLGTATWLLSSRWKRGAPV